MNIRELIDALLKADVSPSTEVFIKTRFASQVGIWDVNKDRKGGYQILSLESVDDLLTEGEAEDNYGGNE